MRKDGMGVVMGVGGGCVGLWFGWGAACVPVHRQVERVYMRGSAVRALPGRAGEATGPALPASWWQGSAGGPGAHPPAHDLLAQQTPEGRLPPSHPTPPTTKHTHLRMTSSRSASAEPGQMVGMTSALCTTVVCRGWLGAKGSEGRPRWKSGCGGLRDDDAGATFSTSLPGDPRTHICDVSLPPCSGRLPTRSHGP